MYEKLTITGNKLFGKRKSHLAVSDAYNARRVFLTCGV